MQIRFIRQCLLLILLTTCFTLTLQNAEESTRYRSYKGFRSQSNRERDKRATRKQPGFFRTLFSVIYEQFLDTRNTLGAVNQLVNEQFLPENAPITQSTTTPSPVETNVSTPSTTAAPYKIKRTEFNKILQRNFRGLVRLFNIELRDALKQSQKTEAQLRRNESLGISRFQ